MTIRTAPKSAPGLPSDASQQQIIDAVNQIMNGVQNVTLDLTLNANVATTTITDARLHANSFIGFMAMTESAKAAQFAGLKVTNQTKGSAIVNHAVSAATDQTFKVLAMGS